MAEPKSPCASTNCRTRRIGIQLEAGLLQNTKPGRRMHDSSEGMSGHYFAAVVGAASSAWELYFASPGAGIAEGIVEAGRRYEALLAVEARRQHVCVSTVVGHGLRFDATVLGLCFNLQAGARLTRAIPDTESGQLRLTATT